MHQFELKSYLRRPGVLGRDCLLEAGADHPAVVHHLLVRSQLGGGQQSRAPNPVQCCDPGEHNTQYSPGLAHAFPVLLGLLNCVWLINIH